MVQFYGHFGGTYCLNIHGRTVTQASKVEVYRRSERAYFLALPVCLRVSYVLSCDPNYFKTLPATLALLALPTFEVYV
jgi:hypothetical protein